MSRLASDPVFAALTRPQMIGGVTYTYAILNLSVTGEPGTPPARFGLSVIDFMTGVTSALALLAALFGGAFDGFKLVLENCLGVVEEAADES